MTDTPPPPPAPATAPTMVMLTFYCAPGDRDAVAEAIRALCANPIHLREELVIGLDFSDARTAEQVLGELDRAAVDVSVPQAEAEAVIAAVGASRRKLPVRWHITPLLARGRLS